MRMVSARLTVIALAAVALCLLPDQASAFGCGGPFYLGLPGPISHRHGRVAHAKPAESVEPGRRTAAAEDVAPQTNERATSNSAIHNLAKPPTARHFFILISCCHCSIGRFSGRMQKFIGHLVIRTSSIRRSRNIPENMRRSIAAIVSTSAELAAHIGREIAPRDDQKPLVQRLATALGQADGYLIKSCPRDVPLGPVERLKLMEGQIDALIMALEIVRPPLQQFEHSLDDQQRARWNGTQAVADDQLGTCPAGDAETEGWPLPQLEQAIQPSGDQRNALAAVKDDFDRAASELAGQCSGGIPHPASRRLVYIEGRLDATWRAVQTIEVALASFEKELSDQQKARFEALEIVSAR